MTTANDLFEAIDANDEAQEELGKVAFRIHPEPIANDDADPERLAAFVKDHANPFPQRFAALFLAAIFMRSGAPVRVRWNEVMKLIETNRDVDEVRTVADPLIATMVEYENQQEQLTPAQVQAAEIIAILAGFASTHATYLEVDDALTDGSNID